VSDESRLLWQRLLDAGLASGEPPSAPAHNIWYVELGLGAAAWLAALFSLIASALVFNLSGGDQFAWLALLWGVPALLLLRLPSDNAFVGQLGLALLIAADLAAVVALASAFEAVPPVLFACIPLFTISGALSGRYSARVLSFIAACVSWVLLLRWQLIGEPWSHREDSESSLALALLTWALAWLPLLALAIALVRFEPRWMGRREAALIRAMITAVLITLAIATPLTDPFAGWFVRESDGARNWLALWPLLSLLASAAAAAIAFHQRAHVLLAFCLAGVLLHAGHFYYALGVSLLSKSVLMLLAGLALLGTGRMLGRSRQA
jgi:hypothetical protein